MGKKLTLEQFIQKGNEIHSDKYNYNEVNYINSRSKVKIYCNQCKEFFYQKPIIHLFFKSGCPKCSVLNRTNKLEQFVENAIIIHGDKYSYNNVIYINSHHKVNIYCKKCKKYFSQSPNKHLACKNGCPRCKNSKNEIIIENYLNKNGIKFERQKTFDGCKFILDLKFDFYLPDYNLCIEYDGEQHFKKFKWFGGDKRFEKQQITDKIKTDYCLNNNINLFRIPYNKKTIDSLNKFFGLV